MMIVRSLLAIFLVSCAAVLAHAQEESATVVAEAETAPSSAYETMDVSSTENMDARLTSIAERIVDVSAGNTYLPDTYMIMVDACETARKSGVSEHSRVNETWEGAYCSCDALLTFEDWMDDSATYSAMMKFNDNPTHEGLSGLLSKHKIFAHDSVCRPAAEGKI